MSLLSSEFQTFLIFLLPPRLCILKPVLGYPVWPYGKVLREPCACGWGAETGRRKLGREKNARQFSYYREQLIERLEIHVAWLH